MSFDKIFDLTAGVCFCFCNIVVSCHIHNRIRVFHDDDSTHTAYIHILVPLTKTGFRISTLRLNNVTLFTLVQAASRGHSLHQAIRAIRVSHTTACKIRFSFFTNLRPFDVSSGTIACSICLGVAYVPIIHQSVLSRFF